MKRALLATGLVAVLVLLAAVIAEARPKLITLTATPSKATYAPGEDVEITFTFTNTSEENVSVSLYEVGNIWPVRIRKDGRRLRPLERWRLLPEFDPYFEGLSEWEALDPGDSASLVVTVYAGELYRENVSRAGIIKSRLYSILNPGVYTMSFVYKYRGPDIRLIDGGFSGQEPVDDAFHQRIKSNEVSFTVLPN